MCIDVHLYLHLISFSLSIHTYIHIFRELSLVLFESPMAEAPNPELEHVTPPVRT